MRRRDKEITDREQIDGIIRGSQVCRLALAKGGVPYLVPMSFGYDGQAIYLHTAREGKKIDYWLANDQVCFELERDVELRPDPRSPCAWTFSFESVIGHGTIAELTGSGEKERALRQIMGRYSDRAWKFDDATLKNLRAWKISIASLTGKRSRPKKLGDVARPRRDRLRSPSRSDHRKR
jgi:nitroimidazol reductase NimA-like FMN-containing flavoprotein (pyridoxamine 5'-phosphate oxidase superfamily)